MSKAPSAKILVVDDSKLAAKMIQDRLEAAGYAVRVAHNGVEGLAKIKAEVPDLIIADVVMPEMDGYEFCRRLRRYPATAHTPVIMLTSRGGITEKKKGFEAGADDYLVKPVDPAELELRIRALLARARAARVAQPIQARFISVFSLRGGTGVSTVAVNLAVALAQIWQVEVPLVDLALESGQDALMLDIKTRYTLAELSQQDPQAIEEELLDGYLVRHESGVRVLAAPPSPELAGLVTSTFVSTLLPMLKPRFEYVVIDTASTFNEVTLAALDASDFIVVVLTPELAALRAATATLDVFTSLGYPQEKQVPVLNWTFPRGGLPQKNVEAALGIPLRAVIPYERELFVEAINRGVPPVLSHPTAAASRVLIRLAYELSKEEMREQEPESPSPMWLQAQGR